MIELHSMRDPMASRIVYTRSHMVTMKAGISMRTSDSHRITAWSVALGLFLWASAAAAQGTVAPNPRITYLSNAGVPLNNAKICTYVGGTTTPQATYSDEALATALPNPIRTNSAGRPQNASGTETNVYWSAASYRVVVMTAGSDATCSTGTTIYTADNVPAIPTLAVAIDVTGTAGATILAGEVVYLSDGSASCGATAGRWYLADADATCSSTTAGMVGVAPSNIASAASGSIRLQGRVTGLSALTAGDLYYASATAGALTTTPPTNARFIAEADSTTSIVVSGNPGAVKLPDSNGTHSLVLGTTSNLTADRLLTLVTGDVAQTLTLTRPQIPGGRCTLTTATPVTTADVTAATTLYYTPYSAAPNPNQLSLYDGSAAWQTFTLTELSIAVPGTTNTMYDVFVDYTAGVPALEAVAWTNDTTRATPLASQNGVYVQTSDTDSLYVCSFRTTGVSGQTENSFAKRYLWNYYNRVPLVGRVLEGTDSWSYTVATLRQANAATTNQLDFVIGVAEVMAYAEVVAIFSNDTTAGADIVATIGYDSTTTSLTTVLGRYGQPTVVTTLQTIRATVHHYPAIGRHIYVWLEYSQATGITSWRGDAGGVLMQSGIQGWIEG